MAGDDQHDPRDDAPTGEGGSGAPDLPRDVAGMLAEPDVWVDPPAGLADRVVAAVRSEAAVAPLPGPRRAPTWLRPAVLGAAAVVVFLLVGVVALSALGGSAGSDRFTADLVPTGLVDEVGGSIEMRSFDSGLRIDLDAASLPRRDGGQFYEGWLRTVDGLLVPVGTFRGGESVVLWAGVDRRAIVSFAITLEEAEPPDSADHGSSGRVVLRADIPAP